MSFSRTNRVLVSLAGLVVGLCASAAHAGDESSWRTSVVTIVSLPPLLLAAAGTGYAAMVLSSPPPERRGAIGLALTGGVLATVSGTGFLVAGKEEGVRFLGAISLAVGASSLVLAGVAAMRDTRPEAVPSVPRPSAPSAPKPSAPHTTTARVWLEPMLGQHGGHTFAGLGLRLSR